MHRRLIAAVLVGSFGGFVFGFDLGALSAATESLSRHFALAPWAFGMTISASIWGTVGGSILAGRFADKFSRRTLIASCALLYTAAAAGITMPVPSAWLLVLTMRCLCGMAIGGFTVACPLYLAEIAPSAIRGRVVAVFQVQVGVGVLVAFTAGAACSHFAPQGATWRWILGLGAVPAGILFIFARFMPRVTAPSALSSEPPSQRLFARKNTRLILLAASIAIFNQLSGVNVLLLYLLAILASAGVTLSLGHTYTVVISGLSLATTIVGMAFVDRLGRKPLLYLGSVGMAICLLTLGLAIPRHAAPALYLFILVTYNLCFAFSQGTVVWVYLSELFPPGLRGSGQGFGSTIHWVSNAILISIFPSVQHASSSGVFYMFASMMVVQIIVIWLWYPETRGTELGSFAAS